MATEMGIREIREKYGRNLKARQAVNAAIRAELVGGDDCLDAIASLHRLATRLRQRGLDGADDAEAALDSCREVAEAMSNEIARRYGLKTK